MASTMHHGVSRGFGWWYFQLKRMEFRSFGDEIPIFRDPPGPPPMAPQGRGGGDLISF